VDTITLSQEQMDFAQQRACEAGVQDRVRIQLCDYRKLPSSFEHSFDALVACEMIEVKALQLPLRSQEVHRC
jgi:cyclopropane-fatty-acyl-phospholipid synthase